MVPAQVDPTGGGALAVAVTLFVTWLFYGVTLHLAATFFVGAVPSQRAAAAAVAPALVSLVLGRYGLSGGALLSPGLDLAVSILATLVADAIAISASYRLSWRPTLALTLLHFAFATVGGLALVNLLGVT